MNATFKILLSLFLLLLTSQDLWATVTISSVTGASNFEEKIDSTTPVIYGGIGGDSCSGDGIETCNNCTSTLEVCNTERIYPSLMLVINFVSDSAAGDATIQKSDGTIISGFYGTPDVDKGGSSRIEIEWGDLCAGLGKASDCQENITDTIKVGIKSDTDDTMVDSQTIQIKVQDPDPDNDNDANTVDLCGDTPAPDNGICDWTAYPGDEKIYIDQPEKAGSFPDNEGLAFSHIRVYYSTEGFASVTPALTESNYHDIPIETDAEDFYLQDQTVNNLSNLTIYYFRLAMIDPAMNISYITSNDAITDACGSLTPADTDACRFRAMPDKVFGLLTEDLNCFVSTAAFGSSYAPPVETFRQFRNRFLLPSSWGQKFVKAYYNWGPKAARWIVGAEWRRSLARVTLWPAWGFAWLSLKWGLSNAVLFIATLMALPLLIWKWRKLANLA